MRYLGAPMGMWALFAGSFRANLTSVLGLDRDTAKAVTGRAATK